MLSFLAHTKIKTKFLIIPSVILVSVLLFSVALVHNLNQQYAQLIQYAREDLSHAQKVTQYFSTLPSQHQNLLSAVSKAEKSNRGLRWQQKKNALLEQDKRFKENFEKLTVGQLDSPQNKKTIENFLKALNGYIESNKAVLELVGKDKNLLTRQLVQSNQLYNLLKQYSSVVKRLQSSKTEQSIQKYQEESFKKLRIVLVGIIVLFISVIALSLLLAHYLSQPILNLVGTIKTIAETSDYKLRAKKECEGEVGVLVDGFNQMLFSLERAESSFLSTKNRMDNIFNSLQHMLIVTSSKGLIKTVNPITLEKLAYPRNEIIDQTLDFMVYDNADTPQPVDWQSLHNSGELAPQAMNFKTKSGDFIPVTFSTSAMKDKSGEFLGLVCLAQVEE